MGRPIRDNLKAPISLMSPRVNDDPEGRLILMSGVDKGDDTDDGEAELTPWIDSLNRFERILDIQIDTLDIIDDKAQQTARIVAVLLGLILTAIPLAFRFGGPTLYTAAIHYPRARRWNSRTDRCTHWGDYYVSQQSIRSWP